MPLVLAFHGMTGTSSSVEAQTRFSALADLPEGGFIAVYPQGVMINGITHWNHLQLAEPEPDDVAFVASLLDRLAAQLCIDTERVYATGFSNGAMMSVRLACSLPERIAGIGLVAGAYYPPSFAHRPEECSSTRALPVITFHGTDDDIIPFGGGGGMNMRLAIDNDTPEEDVMADWAAHNACVSRRQASDVSASLRMVRYTGCAGGTAVQLYIIQGGGHVWPGAPKAPPPDDGANSIDATPLMWQFFQAMGH